MAFKFTEEQLNTLDKSFIVNLFLQLQEQNDKLSGEIQELNKKIEVLIEQITLANKNRFGRFSEKMTDTAQICFMEVDRTIVFFNETNLDAEEPDTLESKSAQKSKAVGKKEADIKGLLVNIIHHYMTEEELTAEFGENGWKQFPDAISKRYRFIPAKANNLKPYDYFVYLLDEIPKHMDEEDCSFLEDLLPWSQNYGKEFESNSNQEPPC